MKNLVLLTIVILSACLLCSSLKAVSAPETQNTFLAANHSYEAGSWQDAASKYLSALDSLGPNSIIFYNLGNTYYKAGELGKAIQYYQKALELAPRDEDIRQNLAIARQRTKDQETQSAQGFAYKIVAAAHEFFSLNELTIIFLVCYLLVCLLAIFRLFLKNAVGSFLLIFLIVLLIFPSLSLAVKIYQQEFLTAGVIITKETDVYSGPGDNYEHAFTLHEGKSLHILQQRGEWSEIKIDNNLKGWVKTDTVGAI